MILNFIFTPFGRGTAFDSAVVQAAYDNIRTEVTNNLLDGSNFADNAGIPEIYFSRPGGTTQHAHADGSLATNSIHEAALGWEAGLEWVITQNAKVLTIFGQTQSFPAAVPGDYTVEFKDSAFHTGGFLDGTTPVVIMTLVAPDSSTPVTGYWARVFPRAVTSNGFIFRYESGGASLPLTKTFFAWYMAVGQAPGYLVNPNL